MGDPSQKGYRSEKKPSNVWDGATMQDAWDRRKGDQRGKKEANGREEDFKEEQVNSPGA